MQRLVSAIEMRELDRQTIEDLKIPGRTLMEVAGRGVAAACARRLPVRARVAVACGTGNNGGDGFVAARALAALGHEVRVFIVGERDRIRGDARSALEPIERLSPELVVEVRDAKGLWQFASYLDGADLAVDALLGTGLKDDVRGLLADAIDVLNDHKCPVVAVDIPSGVDADTGAALGRGVEAAATVTFGFAKRGHYLYPGAELRGELTTVDIGIPAQLAERLGVVGRLLEPSDLGELVPRRNRAAHKGNFGHLVVWAGSRDRPGAAILALGGALRSGVGLVSWATDAGAVTNGPPRPAEAMLLLREEGESPERWAERLLAPATALALGPGLGTDAKRSNELAALLDRCAVPICVDADGLNMLAAEPELWKRVRAPLVITPHPKEMSRVCGAPVQTVQRDRFAVALELALARSAVVVLKGAGTVIADPEGTVAIVNAGNPGMATGGTGDVLTGVIGSFLAQGLEPGRAAHAGALLHAMAGDTAVATRGEAGLTAGDLLEAMGTVLARCER